MLDLDVLRKNEIKVNGKVHSALPFTLKHNIELQEKNFNIDTIEGINEELKYLSSIIFPEIDIENDIDIKFLKDYRFLLMECAFGIKKDLINGEDKETGK